MKTSIFCLCMTLLSCMASATPTVFTNVKGYTFNSDRQLQRFSSLAFEKGKVLEIGDQSLLEKYPTAQHIEGKGKTLLPGLIDSHGHVIGLGQNLLQVDVRDIKSAKATVAKVKAYADNNPQLQWVIGRGWNQVLWQGKEFPTAKQLDELVTSRPVWLRRVDGHAGWANSKALSMVGINKDTLDPPGGEILRDKNGEPTGVLIDNAMNLLEAHLPKNSDDFLKHALNAAGEHLLSQGITSAHDAGINFKQYNFYQEQAEKGALPIRVYGMLSVVDPQLTSMLKNGYINDSEDFLSIRSVKVYGDGALGSRGAALLAPYSDDHNNSGLLVTKLEDIKPVFDQVLGHKFQLNYHAIGDRANRLALDQFEDSFNRVGGQSLRNRVEHAQVIHVDDIPRFKTLKIIPAMQPTHATSDKNMAQDRIGEQRLKGAYAWQTFLKQGTRIAAGSDFPVELANPFFGLHAAVTRQDRDNQPEEGWIKEQRMSVEQALLAFTLDGAYAGHQEKILGSLEAGKWADFILLDQDLFTVDPKDIWKIQVLQTWIAGNQVYVRE